MAPAIERSARVAIVTCARLPEPDPDEQLILERLNQAGLEAQLLSWDDPSSDPAGFDLCVLHSTWNYYRTPEQFGVWIERTAARTRLINPPPVVRWNLHKRYLAELERAGLPIVPTEFCDRGSERRLQAIVRDRGWSEVVIKPCISAASFMTRRFRADEIGAGQAFLRQLLSTHDAMVQPYFARVETGGERAAIWLDGDATHAVEKRRRFAGDDERIGVCQGVTATERELLAAALSCVPGAVHYARLDTLLDDDGQPRIGELELIEPSLFLAGCEPAAARFVAMVRRAAGVTA